MLKLKCPTEFQECKAFWQYCQLKPILYDYLVKIPNEGKREAWYGRSLRAIGLRPGVPDYLYVRSNDRFHCCWIEMKRADEKTHKKNSNQEMWIELLNDIGHFATYAYGAEHAIQIINDYNSNKI